MLSAAAGRSPSLDANVMAGKLHSRLLFRRFFGKAAQGTGRSDAAAVPKRPLRRVAPQDRRRTARAKRSRTAFVRIARVENMGERDPKKNFRCKTAATTSRRLRASTASARGRRRAKHACFWSRDCSRHDHGIDPPVLDRCCRPMGNRNFADIRRDAAAGDRRGRFGDGKRFMSIPRDRPAPSARRLGRQVVGQDISEIRRHGAPERPIFATPEPTHRPGGAWPGRLSADASLDEMKTFVRGPPTRRASDSSTRRKGTSWSKAVSVEGGGAGGGPSSSSRLCRLAASPLPRAPRGTNTVLFRRRLGTKPRSSTRPAAGPRPHDRRVPAIVIEPHQTVVVEGRLGRPRFTARNHLVLAGAAHRSRSNGRGPIGTAGRSVMLEIFNQSLIHGRSPSRWGWRCRTPPISVNNQGAARLPPAAVFDGSGALRRQRARTCRCILGSMDRRGSRTGHSGERGPRVAAGVTSTPSTHPYKRRYPTCPTSRCARPVVRRGGAGAILFWVASRGHHCPISAASRRASMSSQTPPTIEAGKASTSTSSSWSIAAGSARQSSYALFLTGAQISGGANSSAERQRSQGPQIAANRKGAQELHKMVAAVRLWRWSRPICVGLP